MNIHVLILHTSIILFLKCAFSQIIAVENDKESDEERSDASEESESLHESYRPHHMKHSKIMNVKGHNIKRREYAETVQKNCAIMYKNGDPVGILQPYEDSYKLLPIDAEEELAVDINPIMSKRQAFDAEVSNFEEDTKAKASNDRYPYIFAKFKVDSKMDKAQESRPRRDLKPVNLMNEKHLNSLNSALSKIEENSQLSAEDDLQNILNEMGLIDDENRLDKRELEEEKDGAVESANEAEENKGIDKEAVSNTHNKVVTSGIVDSSKVDEEEPSMELAGDEREKRDEVSEEMKKRLQENLSKLKEEVRTEIENLKTNIEESEEVNEENEDEEEKNQRRKRNIMATLVDEETSDIDPLMASDDSLIPHIRRRRHIHNGLTNIAKPDDVAETSNKEVFLTRSLKEYDNNEENEDQNDIDDESLEEKRNAEYCQCSKGDKNCKCADPNQDFKRKEKPRFEDGEYYLDTRPDAYVVIEERPEGDLEKRKKRNTFDDLVAIHGGGPVVNHLLAVRKRSMFPRERFKRAADNRYQSNKQLKLSNMLDEDLFGALPQGYEGELARYKRIKRVS
ncbi:uncharacterized protein PF11_0207-like [Sitophilus oryzae]|uniref:Uncharacterized protein PF11_0207-like n=1 Tax=Sitophilus oryzae TaxID=7048 RepID=A0A6J2XTJ6_SITOR|nr:uncharacterized protein PF11_0207-like [Sitophilus oryzae]